MPNPLTLTAKQNCKAQLFKRANWQQRITMRKGGVVYQHVLDSKPIEFQIEKGDWKITHEFQTPGSNKWVLGIKGVVWKESGETSSAGWDDGINEGDGDHNDANVVFIYKEKKLGW